MRKTKWLALLMSGVLAFGCMAGCGGTEEPAEDVQNQVEDENDGYVEDVGYVEDDNFVEGSNEDEVVESESGVIDSLADVPQVDLNWDWFSAVEVVPGGDFYFEVFYDETVFEYLGDAYTFEPQAVNGVAFSYGELLWGLYYYDSMLYADSLDVVRDFPSYKIVAEAQRENSILRVYKLDWGYVLGIDFVGEYGCLFSDSISEERLMEIGFTDIYDFAKHVGDVRVIEGTIEDDGNGETVVEPNEQGEYDLDGTYWLCTDYEGSGYYFKDGVATNILWGQVYTYEVEGNLIQDGYFGFTWSIYQDGNRTLLFLDDGVMALTFVPSDAETFEALKNWAQ